MNFVSDVLDSIPVVGQVKGLAHHISGDRERADRAMERSTRATGCVAGALGGAVTAGPAGAVAGCVAGGSTVDSLLETAKRNNK